MELIQQINKESQDKKAASAAYEKEEKIRA